MNRIKKIFSVLDPKQRVSGLSQLRLDSNRKPILTNEEAEYVVKHLRETPFLDDAVRRELWAILYLSPKNDHVIQLLVDKLHSPDDCGVRSLAICILDHLNYGYVEQLAERFKDDQSIYVQIAAARF